TVVAWIFIALTGFGSMVGALQIVMFETVMKPMGFEDAMSNVPPGMPEGIAPFFQHFDLMIYATSAMTVLTLVASIGLLKRREWARKLFIAMMVVSILWQLGSLALQIVLQSQMMQMFTIEPNAPDMGPFFIGFMVFAGAIALAFSALFGWIIKRLVSPPIVAEFQQ
ncbi:MAG: hypothetical protein ACRC2H_04605, partial [Silanimonas sp.]